MRPKTQVGGRLIDPRTVVEQGRRNGDGPTDEHGRKNPDRTDQGAILAQDGADDRTLRDRPERVFINFDAEAWSVGNAVCGARECERFA